MTVDRVWVQKERGEFVNRNGFVARRGFEAMGREVRFFEWPELRDGAVPLVPGDMVVGGVETVRRAWRALGVRPPDPLDLPGRLEGFRGRRVWRATLADVRGGSTALSSPSW